MLRSMTGYGSAQALVEGVDYSVELRSVNGRYFKGTLRLGEIWSREEAAIEKILRQRLNRGTINLTVRMRFQSEQAAAKINTAALDMYVERGKGALGENISFELGSMLSLPGVCEPPSAEEICAAGRDGLFKLINQSVDALLEMREREGKLLAEDLLSQCSQIEQQLEIIEPRTSVVVEDFNKRLLSRVNDLVNLAKITVNEQDLVREVAVFAERSDINEEIQRLRGHIAQFREVMASGEQAGRKLDFISQEMLREANTIGSKANDQTIARAIVEIKTNIDRIKEQVQNAE